MLRCWLFVLVGLSACAESDYRLWLIVPSGFEDAARAEVAVLPTRCPEDPAAEPPPDALVVRTWRIGEDPPELARFDQGVYGFSARVADEGCHVRWIGCELATVVDGGQGRIEVHLDDVAGAGCLPSDDCTDPTCGRIELLDAGEPDAFVDASADASADAGPSGCGTPQECFPGCEIVTFEGHPYAKCGWGTWAEAVAYCAAQPGWGLVRVGSVAEDQFLLSACDESCWIDASDQVVEGSFRQSDGAEIGYTQWCDNEPNNELDLEDCALAVHTAYYCPNADYVCDCWNDARCDSDGYAICEQR